MTATLPREQAAWESIQRDIGDADGWPSDVAAALFAGRALSFSERFVATCFLACNGARRADVGCVLLARCRDEEARRHVRGLLTACDGGGAAWPFHCLRRGFRVAVDGRALASERGLVPHRVDAGGVRP